MKNLKINNQNAKDALVQGLKLIKSGANLLEIKSLIVDRGQIA